ncbi:MAG TPA: hypothetical protein VHM20_03685 [Gammaproteobacteria bacterium]|nr:hypothetical protein [Gammaproteobacteria bacterium]
MDIELSTNPESNPTILKRSFRLYLASFIKVIPLAFLLSIIVFIPEIFSWIFDKQLFSPLISMDSFWSLFFNLIIVFVYMALLWRMQSVLYKVRDRLRDDVEQVTRKFLRVVVAGLIVTFILGSIAFFTMFIYSLIIEQKFFLEPTYFAMFIVSIVSFVYAALVTYLYFAFYFYLPLILTENAGIFTSLLRSFVIVYHNWWRVFLLQITPGLVFFVLLLAVRFIFHYNVNIFLLSSPGQISIGVYIFHIIMAALFIPWIAAILLLQLHDLELRYEYNIVK